MLGVNLFLDIYFNCIFRCINQYVICILLAGVKNKLQNKFLSTILVS